MDDVEWAVRTMNRRRDRRTFICDTSRREGTFVDQLPVFLYVHIAAPTIWVGGATMLQFMAIRARTRGIEGLLAFGSDWGRGLRPVPTLDAA